MCCLYARFQMLISGLLLASSSIRTQLGAWPVLQCAWMQLDQACCDPCAWQRDHQDGHPCGRDTRAPALELVAKHKAAPPTSLPWGQQRCECSALLAGAFLSRTVLKAHTLARGGPVAGRVRRLGHASCFATRPPSSFGYGFGTPPGAVLVGSGQHPPIHPGPPPAARPQRALRSPEGGMLCA